MSTPVASVQRCGSSSLTVHVEARPDSWSNAMHGQSVQVAQGITSNDSVSSHALNLLEHRLRAEPSVPSLLQAR
jgi:hypothetical protein